MDKAETLNAAVGAPHDAPPGVERRLASASVSIDQARPDALLRLGEGKPRGFWAREGRWFAHIGETGRVEVGASDDVSRRFRDVWEGSRSLFSCSWKDPQSEVAPPSPRLFGGFSFGAGHEPKLPWAAFPPACFLLPEVELMGGGGEGSGVLTLRRFLFPGENPDQCRDNLRSALAEMKERVLSGPGDGNAGDPWIPATRAETDPAAWRAFVLRALGEIKDGTFSKVVLARVQNVSVEGRLDPVEVLLNLWKGNPGSHVFLFEPAPGATLMGAAPETVATVAEGLFRATAVAGSIARGDTSEEQQALAKSLLKSRKDRREHQMCVEAVMERLATVAEEVRAPDEPHVLTLSTIQHLETAIEASLHPEETVLSALEVLHPTPAVCGLPRDQALEFLQREEPFQRGWYAGPVGWFDGDGNGVFVPALRSVVGCGSEWRLFAGAGIVAGSDPSQEWEETQIKFLPVLKALSGALALDGSGGLLAGGGMKREDINTVWAETFVDELARGGVTDLCVAPGSRSTPIILAAFRDGRFRMYPIVDERSAGFFALGLGKASGRPAAVITTSGTAAANLYPSVIEASQGEVPLLVLTADRPHRLRDADGNQAIDQLRLFGTFPRGFFEIEPARAEEASLRHLRALAGRAIALAKGPPMGPVHLNFPFEKPLEPASGPAVGEVSSGPGRPGEDPHVRVAPRYSTLPEAEVLGLRETLTGSSRGVILAGPVPNPGEVGPAVLGLAAATGFPVLADPLSGARFSPSLGAKVVAGYDLFLRSGPARAALAPELILRVGSSPTSSAALAYLEDHGNTRQVVVDEGHRWKDHLSVAHEYVPAAPGPLLERLATEISRVVDRRWIGLWEEAETSTRSVLGEAAPLELLEGEILAAVAESLPQGANLLVSSSMPIRDLDAFAAPGTKTLNVFGNRGASGIDGLVSTTLGIAANAGGSVPTVGVLGDLAFMHDMNGLLALKDLNLRATFVLVNNDGGGIFHTLPVRDHEPAFSRFFATPHGLDFQKAAELYQLPHESTRSLEEFRSVFAKTLAGGGPAIVEVHTDREATHIRRAEVVAAVIEAVRGLGRS